MTPPSARFPEWVETAVGRWGGCIKIAHELKKQLHEVMGWSGPMTHRQYLALVYWMDLEWDRPNRTDYYLMQVAACVERLIRVTLHMNTNDVQVANMKLVFAPAPTPEQMSQDEEALREHEMNISKSMAMARAGLSGRFVQEVPMPPAPRDAVAEEQPEWTGDVDPKIAAMINAEAMKGD